MWRPGTATRGRSAPRARWCLAAAASLLLAACGSHPAGELPFEQVFVHEATIRLREPAAHPIGRPDVVVPWGDRIAVADGVQADVKVFARDGRWLRSLGRPGDGPGEFRYPAQVAEGADGSLLVFDGAHGRVSVWAPDGSYRTAWTVPRPELGDLEALGGDALVAATRGEGGHWRIDRLGPDGRDRGRIDALPPDHRIYEANVGGAGLAVVDSFVAVSSAVTDTLRIHDLRTGTTRRVAVGGGVYQPPAWPAKPFPRAGEAEQLTRWINGQTWIGDVLPLGGPWVAVGMLRPGQAGTTPLHRYALTSVRGGRSWVTTPQPLLLRRWSAGRVAALRVGDQGEVEVSVFRFVAPAGREGRP